MIYKSYLIENKINTIKNKIFLFYGENLGLKNDFKREIKLNYSKANISSFSQDEILKNQNNFQESFLNGSLFEDLKIYFIDQTNDKIFDLICDLEKKIENQKIYLFSDILEKKSKLRNYFEKSKNLGVVACYNDNEIGLKKILLAKLKDFEGLTSENINFIINNANLDRTKLNNEIDKIKTYFIHNKINNSELLKLLNLRENDNFNELKDAALNGDNNRTNVLLNDTIIEQDKLIYYIITINQRLIKLREILSIENKTVEQTIETLRPPIFWKDKNKVLSQVKKWNIAKINKMLQSSFSLEKQFKSNSELDKNILIKKFLIDVCNCANS